MFITPSTSPRIVPTSNASGNFRTHDAQINTHTSNDCGRPLLRLYYAGTGVTRSTQMPNKPCSTPYTTLQVPTPPSTTETPSRPPSTAEWRKLGPAREARLFIPQTACPRRLPSCSCLVRAARRLPASSSPPAASTTGVSRGSVHQGGIRGSEGDLYVPPHTHTLRWLSYVNVGRWQRRKSPCQSFAINGLTFFSAHYRIYYWTRYWEYKQTFVFYIDCIKRISMTSFFNFSFTLPP